MCGFVKKCNKIKSATYTHKIGIQIKCLVSTNNSNFTVMDQKMFNALFCYKMLLLDDSNTIPWLESSYQFSASLKVAFF